MTQQEVLKISKGNPGAMQAIMSISTSNFAEDIINRLNNCPSIQGTNLYVLSSDLCNNDVQMIHKLCTSSISNTELEDACSRQDYSGRAIAAKYL